MSGLEDFELEVSTGAAMNAADGDGSDPIASLPRLFRIGLGAIGRRKHIPQQIAADIIEVAPAGKPKVEAWLAKAADAPMNALVKWLDAEAVKSDQPVLQSLADTVLLVSLTPFTRHRDGHARVALALKVVYDKLPFDLDSDTRFAATKLLIGWSMVGAGAFTSTRFTHAIDMAPALANSACDDLSNMLHQRAKEEAKETAVREEASDGLRRLRGAKPSLIIPPGHVVVCPQPGGNKVGSLTSGLTHIVGQPVPLAGTPDLALVRRDLLTEFPHLAATIDRLLGDLVGREHVHLKPLVLVGAPGAGKSRLVRRLGELLGISVWRTAAATPDGGAFGGTDRRWSNTQVSHPLLAIAAAKVANPVVMIDEIDKSPPRNEYGRLWDVLLTMLEPETSRRFLDPSLQVECDLSMISFVATANSLDPLPSPLRDRMRAIWVPEPTAEDLDALLPLVVNDVARERGMAAVWVEPLNGSERNLIAENWLGGSLRQLRRLVETVMISREVGRTMH
ncbi:AAA family ATPase [Bosea sp. (in: a-proteobacteria)]|uniref:AAA family ATPase n=1 Tax=Bosea sp. (in: a-proteobacteria) TaxID=1871050 RepID=UPI0025B8B2B3|nr:AAA family ATPase [Bosea sp. (in: a-proteobacteria)]